MIYCGPSFSPPLPLPSPLIAAEFTDISTCPLYMHLGSGQPEEPPTTDAFIPRWEKEVGEDFKHEVDIKILEVRTISRNPPSAGSTS